MYTCTCTYTFCRTQTKFDVYLTSGRLVVGSCLFICLTISLLLKLSHERPVLLMLLVKVHVLVAITGIWVIIIIILYACYMISKEGSSYSSIITMMLYTKSDIGYPQIKVGDQLGLEPNTFFSLGRCSYHGATGTSG